MVTRSRLWPALLVGAAYFVIGWTFALPANHAHAWRLAAWIVSGLAFAGQIAHEHFRLRTLPGVTAMHAALAAAIGALALAVAGMIHSLSTTGTIRAAWLLALVLWPAITAVPAFLVAVVAATLLARLPRRSEGE